MGNFVRCAGILLFTYLLAMSPCHSADAKFVEIIKKATVYAPDGRTKLGNLNVGDKVRVSGFWADKSGRPIVGSNGSRWLVIEADGIKGRGIVMEEKVLSETKVPNHSATAVTDLGLRLLWERSKNTENVAVSPYGLWANISLWLEGARGKTRAALERDLGISARTALTKPDTPELQTAQRLLIRPKFPLTPTYMSFLKESSVEVIPSDFDEQTRLDVNSWLEERTNHQITNFYSPENWDPKAKMIFLNVAALNAFWATPFEKANRPMRFNNVVDVASMRLKSELKVYRDSDSNLEVIFLPYRDSELVAAAVLPTGEDGDSIVRRFSGTKLHESLPRSESEYVDLYMPPFAIESDTDVLASLSLHSLVDSKADFSGMTSEEVAISDVRQKVSLIVDEIGTLAGSVDATVVKSGIAREIVVDRPFLFFVLSKSSGAVYFAAYVQNPVRAPERRTRNKQQK